MDKPVYNAVIFFPPAQRITFHNITTVVNFVSNIVFKYDPHTIRFYDARSGLYAGYWKPGLSFGIHSPGRR